MKTGILQKLGGNIANRLFGKKITNKTPALKSIDNVKQALNAYRRPSGATTPEMRGFVQGKSCATCGESAPRMIADHIKPLVAEYYESGGKIDLYKMHDLRYIQPQCPCCSAAQGARMSLYSKMMKGLLGLVK